METENDNTIPFLDTLVIKDSEGRLTTSVYRKTTHTDQCLSYDSHHPQSVKRGVVKCLYDRSKNIITKPSVISEEKKHLSSVIVLNGYPYSFVANITKSKNHPTSNKEPTTEIKSTEVLPSLKGLSKPLRRCLQKHGIRSVFKSDTTLRSHLVRPKDAVYPRKQDGVLYKTHCECGSICIGETGRYVHERVKEHDRDLRLSRTQPFLNTPIRHGIIRSGRRLSLLTDTLTGTLVELKRLRYILAQDFTTTILTGTVELRFLKRGCL